MSEVPLCLSMGETAAPTRSPPPVVGAIRVVGAVGSEILLAGRDGSEAPVAGRVDSTSIYASLSR